jgi:hypothetical protein
VGSESDMLGEISLATAATLKPEIAINEDFIEG